MRGRVHHGRSNAHGVVGSGHRCEDVCVAGLRDGPRFIEHPALIIMVNNG